MLSIPSVDRYVAARPSLVERAAFESSLGLFLATNVAPSGLSSVLAIVLGVALAVAFVPAIVRGMGEGDTIWPVTKRPVELRVSGPGVEPLPGVVRGGWFIMAAAAAAIVGLVVWLVQRDSYGIFLVAATLWIVGSIVQVVFVYRAESVLIAARR